MWIRLGVVLALPLTFAACGSGGSGSGPVGRTVPDLDGTSWIATSIVEHGQPHALVPGSQVRLDFAGGTLSISGGCNGMSGSYTLSEAAELGTGTLSSTLMGCSQPLMDQDKWLSDTVFSAPLVASVDGNTLTLSRAGLQLELTDRASVEPDASLQGTAWQLDGIRTGETMASVPSGQTTPTLSITTDGTVTVHTGCNSGGGSATVSGSTITFGPLRTTKKACPEAEQQTESAVLTVLRGTVSWSITEQTLTLTKGDRGLVYRAAP
jgi:heat shock protein HslJ